jgi:hypothetical protein
MRPVTREGEEEGEGEGRKEEKRWGSGVGRLGCTEPAAGPTGPSGMPTKLIRDNLFFSWSRLTKLQMVFFV